MSKAKLSQEKGKKQKPLNNKLGFHKCYHISTDRQALDSPNNPVVTAKKGPLPVMDIHRHMTAESQMTDFRGV